MFTNVGSSIEKGIYKHYRKDLYVELIGIGYINKSIASKRNKEKLRQIASQCYLFCNNKKASFILNTKDMCTYEVIPYDDILSIPNYWFQEPILLYKIIGDSRQTIIARDYTSFFAMTSRGVSNFVKVSDEIVA